MNSEFFIPETFEEALEIKGRTPKSFFLGGGTILNLWTKNSSKKLISLHKLGLKKVERHDGCIFADSMVTLTELSENPLIRDNVPLADLVASCRIVSKNIRNMATVGGVLGSRYTRSDFLPLFLVLDCEVVSLSSEGERRESVEEFLGRPPSKTTLIRGLAIREESKPFFFKTGRFARSSNDLPVVKVAVHFAPEGVAMKDLRIGCGGLYDKPLRLYELEERLEGMDYSDPGLHEIIGKTLGDMAPGRSDIRGPQEMKKAFVAAILEDILASAGKEEC